MRAWCHVALLACLSIKWMTNEVSAEEASDADHFLCDDASLCSKAGAAEKKEVYMRFGRKENEDDDTAMASLGEAFGGEDSGLDDLMAGDSVKRQDPYIRFGKRQDPYIRFGKRQDPYIRFGKKQDPYIRFGKRQDPYIRFGKRQDPYIRFGKRQDPYIRFGKRQDPYIRFGKRQDPYIRFGKRQDPYIRFGKRQDPYIRFGRSSSSDEGQLSSNTADLLQDLNEAMTRESQQNHESMDKRQDPYIRFGKRQDPYIRFGKRQDPYIRFGKRQDPYIRFGKRQDPYIRFGKRQDPYIRFGKRQDPYIRFGKRTAENGDQKTLKEVIAAVSPNEMEARRKRSAQEQTHLTLKPEMALQSEEPASHEAPTSSKPGDKRASLAAVGASSTGSSEGAASRTRRSVRANGSNDMKDEIHRRVTRAVSPEGGAPEVQEAEDAMQEMDLMEQVLANFQRESRGRSSLPRFGKRQPNGFNKNQFMRLGR